MADMQARQFSLGQLFEATLAVCLLLAFARLYWLPVVFPLATLMWLRTWERSLALRPIAILLATIWLMLSLAYALVGIFGPRF